MKSRIFIFIILSLLPVYGFASVIKIPNSQSPPGSEIRIPIVVENADSLAGAEISVSFNGNLLIPLRVETTRITADFMVMDSISANKIAVSLASPTGIPDGNGAIANLIFRVPASVSSEDTTLLTFQKVRLYDKNTDPIAINVQNGLFTVSEKAFVFPNIFTPNGDGYNDFAQFIIPKEQEDAAEVFVFHPSNKLVRQLSPQNSDNLKWDGTDENGHKMEPGVYIYVIKTNGEYFSNGTVTLMR